MKVKRRSILLHPAAPNDRERQIATKIKDRVSPHATGTDAGLLCLLLLRAKVDGPDYKLATIYGMLPGDVSTGLRDAVQRLRQDAPFQALFHLILAAL
jgi:hypothetical protein